MSIQKSLLIVSALALSAFTAPLPECSAAADATYKPALTAANLIAIAPATASCAGAKKPEQCADAERAAAALNKAFEKYKITSTGEQAALIAYELFESVNFQFDENQYPGRPGQGTRMMAMPPFVKLYATSVVGADAVAQAEAAGGDAGLSAVLELVNADDEKSFGSAAWFLTSQCTPEVRQGLVAETVEGWHNFLTKCVGTELDDKRDTPWVAAKQIMLGG